MKGMISLPQFDTNLFKVGKAITVIRNDYKSFCYDCLIQQSTPLQLQLVYVDEQGEADTLIIKAEDVTSKLDKIYFLVTEKED